jgi:hypothetical protein
MSESLLFAGSKSCNIPRAPVLGHSGLAPARIVNSPRLYACSKPLLRESVVTSPTICEIDEPCWYIPLTVQYIDTISVTLLGVCCSFDLYMPRPRPISVGPITERRSPSSQHFAQIRNQLITNQPPNSKQSYTEKSIHTRWKDVRNDPSSQSLSYLELQGCHGRGDEILQILQRQQAMQSACLSHGTWGDPGVCVPPPVEI